ncbi:MAG: hypothetical protein ACO3GO_01790 [Terrimicrobiaceae bacterium]
MVKTLTIVGLLLVAALALPVFSSSTILPDHHSAASKCCCTDKGETSPLASCGCRTCPASATVGASLIADFSKAMLPVPDFQSISWKTYPAHAEARFAEPPTPPPRIPA